jgi:trans-2-enoyl-CoA reductase
LLPPPPPQAELDKLKFFARPKLALDGVGGASAARLADALAAGGQMVVYGCVGGASPALSWRSWVFQGLSVRGFNARAWMRDHRARLPALLESLGRLVAAGKLGAAVTEYELSTEFHEALDHAMERGKNTKVVLTVSDVGVQY